MMPILGRMLKFSFQIPLLDRETIKLTKMTMNVSRYTIISITSYACEFVSLLFSSQRFNSPKIDAYYIFFSNKKKYIKSTTKTKASQYESGKKRIDFHHVCVLIPVWCCSTYDKSHIRKHIGKNTHTHHAHTVKIAEKAPNIQNQK